MKILKTFILLVVIASLVLIPTIGIQADEAAEMPNVGNVDVYLIVHNGYLDTPSVFVTFDYWVYKNYEPFPRYDYFILTTTFPSVAEKLKVRNADYDRNWVESLKMISEYQKEVAKSLSVILPGQRVLGAYFCNTFQVWSNYDDNGQFNFTWRTVNDLPY